MSKTLLLYTREPQDSFIYDPKLANSMHIAIKQGNEWRALNHNSGVFFAKATDNDNGALNAKSLKAPYAFRLADGSYGVIAVRTEPNGEDDTEDIGSVLVAVTKDFLHYTELGTLKVCDKPIDRVKGKYCEQGGAHKICVTAGGARYAYKLTDFYALEGEPVECEGKCSLEAPDFGDIGIEGAKPSCTVEVSDEIAEKLVKKLITPECVAVEVPEMVTAKSAEELREIKALVRYSDGSTDEKHIDWELDGVDFTMSGSREIRGKVHQDNFVFPFSTNRADPCMAKWQGKYYFIATDDSSHEQNMYIREAASIPELTTAPETLILDNKTFEGIGGLLWAPEFHEINGRLYIFHAATPGPFFNEESHVRVLRDGGDPMNRDDWSRPVRVTKADGSELCEAGKTITLDMTVFEWEGAHYAVWSQRQFVPVDLGAWLVIAKLNSDDPTRLASEPVVLSKPEYGWANNHTFVDEGPFALMRGDKLWLSYSSAAVDSTYVVSFLTLEKGGNPLDPADWTKANFPSLTSRSVEGEYGPGHNAYVIDDDGKVWNTYHARPGVNAPRSSGIRRVHFDVYDEPVLDMTEELDVKPELREVKTVLEIS